MAQTIAKVPMSALVYHGPQAGRVGSGSEVAYHVVNDGVEWKPRLSPPL